MEIELNLDLWPKQAMAFDSPATEILFGGASRGGKSHLGRVKISVACLEIPNLMCTLIRKKNQDILDNHVYGPNGFNDLLAPLIAIGLVKVTQENVTFYNGSRITFKHCFTGDTQVLTSEGPKAIKDLVNTEGYVSIAPGVKTPFRSVRKTQSNVPVVKVVFSDGSSCRCTPDHRFLTDRGWVEAQNLEGKQCVTNESQLSAILNKSSLGSSISSTVNTLVEAQTDYIVSFGSIITAQLQMILKSITRTITDLIIRLKTLNCLNAPFTELCTPQGQRLKLKQESTLLRDKSQPSYGMQAPRVGHGTENTSSETKINYINSLQESVISANNNTMQGIQASIVAQSVDKLTIERSANSKLIRFVRYVAQFIKPANIEHHKHAAISAVTNCKHKRCVNVRADGCEDVYCLTVPEYGFFPLFNSVLVSNCQDERQFSTAQGIASHILFIDEATQISENLIRTFRAWCTMPEEMKAALPEQYKGRLPCIIYTANPIGESVGFFRRHFVKARKPYEIEPVDGFLRQYIPSRVQDNRSENAEAAKGRLTGLLDAATAQALIEGDWDAPVGDFFPEWDEKNITDPFTPPQWWQRWRSFDWGNTDPFACYWLTLSDGEQFEDEYGAIRRFPRGAIIAYKEWYGCDPAEPSKGIGLSNKEIALGILARSEPKFKNVTTLTDSLPFQKRGSEFLMSEEFANQEVFLTQAATQRPQGWAEMRSYIKGIYLTPEDKERTPLFYITRDCPYALDYVPALPRHPLKSNDAAEHGESTHSCDALRYGIFGRHRVVDKAQAEFDPKKVWNPRLGNIPTFDEALEIVRKSKQPKSNW